MVTETDRAWLAGIWDGEGSVTLFHNQEKNGATKLRPVVCVVNTDVSIINKVCDILERAEVSVYIVNRQNSRRNKKHKDTYEIKTTNITEIEKLLVLIEPYITGAKKAKAEILLRYARRRIAKFPDRKYTEEDWNDFYEIRSSETTCETFKVNSTYK